MKTINIFSLFLFIIFFSSYIIKLIILYRKDRISANVLGKAGKESNIHKAEILVKISTFIWGFMWLLLSLFETKIVSIIIPLKTSILINYAGVITTLAGVLIFITAMISMKTSWRVGIDKSTQTKLITTSIYRYSRNPAFVGFDLMFIGVAAIYPGLVTALVAIVNIVAIHNLTLKEEMHLKSTFGDSYIKYMKQTARYILFK